ncbi:MAG: Dna[CI] antecedent, DciA [Thermoleophilia bacterium]|nr:Dna[CI] antecedent, DciA [Thermoleophilia bacterium]
MDDRPQPFIDLADLSRTQLRGMGRGFGGVLEAFTRAAGPEIAQVAMPVSLRSETLTVRCVSASWAQTLGFEASALLERLRAELPEGVVVRRIRTVTGSVAPALSTTPTSAQTAPPLAPLAPADEARLDALVAAIDDPALAAKVRAAASASMRRGAS